MGDTKIQLSSSPKVLRELADRDSDLMFRWINDRQLVILNAPFRPVSAAEHAAWFSGVRNREDVRIFAIAEPASGRTIGYCQLREIDLQGRSAALQIRIGELAMHGKGFGTTAVRELVSFGFGELKLNRIFLQVFRDNVRAYRSYLKCGFKEDNVLSGAVQIEGMPKDIVEMSILKEDVPSLQP